PPPSMVPSPVIDTSRSPWAYRHGECTCPTAPSQRASTTGYSCGSGTNWSTAPASRCRSIPLRSRSAPVRCRPAGTRTCPPPTAAASSMARCSRTVASSVVAGSGKVLGRVMRRAFGTSGRWSIWRRARARGARLGGVGCSRRLRPLRASGVELLVRLGVLADDVVQALPASSLDGLLVVGHRGLAQHELVVGVVEVLLEGGPLGVERLGVQRLHGVGDRVFVVLGHHLVGEVHVLVRVLVGEGALGQA